MSETLTFETAMAQLEGIVRQLEQEELSLEDSIKAYKKGIELSQYCQQALEEARLSITEVSQSGSESNFEENE